jgi:hypothetical protein
VTIPSELDKLEFPALTEFGTAQIRGNVSRYEVQGSSLVIWCLTILVSPSTTSRLSGSAFPLINKYSVDGTTEQTQTSLDISLPALENITALNVYGNVSRIKVPELTYVPFNPMEFDLVTTTRSHLTSRNCII